MKRTLLVDDEDGLRRLLARVLERGGFDVAQFATSAEALVWAETNPVDVLVTDVSLEGVNGFGVAERIAQLNPEALIVLISGYPPDLEALARQPRSTFLCKPFPPKTLLAAIARLAEQAR